MSTHQINIIEILLDQTKELAAISAHQVEMKEDLRQHMKRTVQVEVELKYLHRQINLAHGAIALIVLAGTVASLVKFFN